MARGAPRAARTIQERSRYTYLRPSHTSLIGIREYALDAGGSVAVLDEDEARARARCFSND